MTTLLCSIPQPQDSTSLYRAVGPLETLRRQGGLSLVINPEAIGWPVLKAVDLAFFQRPHTEDRVGAMKMCRRNGKKVWLDYDDNLHAVPLCNRRYSMYGNPSVQHSIASMIAMANIVTVTTPYLAECFRKILKCFPSSPELNTDPGKIIVIPNAYDFELHGPIERPARNKLIMWRGSDSHSKDLWTHTDALASAMTAYPDWNFEFLGEPFWLTIETLKKISKPNQLTVLSPMDPVNFFSYTKVKAPSLFIVPLEDQPFNRSKSNIAWIEATCAGAVTLAPDWDEWRRPGVINYKDVDDFGDKLSKFMNLEFESEKMWRDSRDYILENLELKKQNMTRAMIIEELKT